MVCEIPSLDSRPPKAGDDAEVLIEDTYGWHWAVDVLQDNGFKVHLAHPAGNDWIESSCALPAGPNISPRRGSTPQRRRPPVERRHVGIDLQWRRSAIFIMNDAGEKLSCVRIGNEPVRLLEEVCPRHHRVHLGFEPGAQLHQLGPVAHQLPQLTHRLRADPRLRQPTQPQQWSWPTVIAHVWTPCVMRSRITTVR